MEPTAPKLSGHPTRRSLPVHGRHRIERQRPIEESTGSVLPPSDASDEDESRRSSRGKRRSSSGHLAKQASPQRKKKPKGGQEAGDQSCANVVAAPTVTVTDGKDAVSTARAYAQPAAGPSAPTTPASTPVETAARTPKYCSESAPNTPICQRRSCSPSPSNFSPLTTTRRTKPARKLMSKQTCFVAETMMKTQMCGACGKRIEFYKFALKCASCRSLCHPGCRDKVIPLPCVPVSQTPTTGRATRRGTIADYAPSTSPTLPALVVHCKQEVERRGLYRDGALYRSASGSRRTNFFSPTLR